MAARTIAFDPLDFHSIAGAIMELNRFRHDLIMACNSVLIKCMDQGHIQCRTYVAGNAFYTGELYNSIQKYFDPVQRTASIYTDTTEYAMYVEYGTGVWGGNSPHPEAGAAGWAYDINGHGAQGWVYRNRKDGRVYWSRGMKKTPPGPVPAWVAYASPDPDAYATRDSGWKARPYMYTTKLYLENEVSNITTNVFATF